MENDRNPNRHIGNWHMDVRKILCRRGWIAQLEDAVPDEKARHQQARKRRQVGFHGVHGSSLPTSCPERASYWLKPAPGKNRIARKKLLDPTIAEHRGHIAPMLTFDTVC